MGAKKGEQGVYVGGRSSIMPKVKLGSQEDEFSTKNGEEYGSEGSQEQDAIHTRIVRKDNPFFSDNDEADGEVDSEEQLLNRGRNGRSRSFNSNGNGSSSNGNGSRRRSSGTTSKDSSPDVPFQNHERGDGSRSSSDSSRSSKKAQILEASKVSEGQGRTYIAYAIKYKDSVVKRRYSDFESLRKVLVKLFPMTLIPPIPEKQSLKSYGKAITHSKTNYLLPMESGDSVDLSLSVINGPVTSNDEKLIRHRIRMLTSFLNRLLRNEEIMKTSIVYDFLDPNNKNWNDLITSSLTISSLPKSVLQCNPIDPTNTTKAHTYLPIPSSSNQLLSSKDHNNPTDTDEFSKVEAEYKHYEQLLHSGMYKYSRATTKELNHVREEMKGISSQLAQFSVDEAKYDNGLAELLSHSSDTYDALYENLETLVGNLHYNINEPLGECAHMATAVRELIQYRRLKMVQKELLERSILYKRAQLKKFQQQESNNKQIGDMVNKDLATSGTVNLENPNGPRSYTGKMMNKFNQIASIIKDTVTYPEQDPATAVKTLEKELAQLEESLKVATSDLVVITKTLKDNELPRFTKERNEELIQIFKNYSKYMKENAIKNLKVWKELQQKMQEEEEEA